MSHTWIELNAGILAQNVRSVRSALPAGTEIIFVVKANAYGHGLTTVARHAWSAGIRWFGVAHLDEAAAIRAVLPSARILILIPVDPDELEAVLEIKAIPVIVGEEQALSLAAAAEARRATLTCHAKIDTGMGRLGFARHGAAAALSRVAAREGLSIDGICTHLASAGDAPASFAATQMERFFEVTRECARLGLKLPFRHAANSAGMLSNPAWDLEAVRSGILLYGYRPRAAGSARAIETQPFLQWKSRVAQVKRVPAGTSVSYDSTYVTDHETSLAVVDVGYADGFPRRLSNKGFLLIGGKRRPVRGTVTMNAVIVDLGAEAGTHPGDEAVLLGVQGEESIWADEIAEWCGTIPYEILTGIRTGE